MLGSGRAQHNEGDEGGQLQTSAQDASLWSGSANIRGAADSLLFPLIYSVAVLNHVNPQHHLEALTRRLFILSTTASS